MTIIETLRKSGQLTSEVIELNNHTKVFECDIDYFKANIPFLKGRTNLEVAMFAVELAKKCDISKMDYDEILDDRLENIYNSYKNTQVKSR